MIGKTISHYTILEKLGEGGMGVVYKAEDTLLGRVVAVKFLSERHAASDTEKARLFQEAKAAASLSHPNICAIFEFQQSAETQFFVMEYIEGATLRSKIPVAFLPDALSLAIQIGEALQEAHGKGIVHRDLKCENIMVTAKGVPKVMDFGLAKLKGSLKLTRSSTTVGTLAYMAPEQIQGGEVDSRSDIFSFGVLLFEIITGHLPFRGEHEAAMMYSILNEPAADLRKYRDDVPDDLTRIIGMALEKEPANRYQDIGDLVDDLKRLHAHPSGPGIPLAPPHFSATQKKQRADGIDNHSRSRGRKKYFLIVTLLVLLGLAGAVYWNGLNPKSVLINPAFTTRTLNIPFDNVGYPDISADGNWIVFPAQDENGTWDIYIMNVASLDARRLSNDSSRDADQIGASISPDGSTVAYDLLDREVGFHKLYVISTSNGTSKKIADSTFFGRWRPDGKQIGYIVDDEFHYGFWTMNPDGSGKTRVFIDSLGTRGSFAFAWSPEADKVAWIRSFGGYQEVVVHDLLSGHERQVTNDSTEIIDVNWTKNNCLLITSGKNGEVNLWMVDPISAAETQITRGGGPDYASVASEDRKRIILYRAEQTSRFVSRDIQGKREMASVISGYQTVAAAESPDGRFIARSIYDNTSRTNASLYISKSGENAQRRLTSWENGKTGGVAWSPDGKRIAYTFEPGTAGPTPRAVWFLEPDDPAKSRKLLDGRVVGWSNDDSVIVYDFIKMRSFLYSVGSDRIVPIKPDSCEVLQYDRAGIVFRDYRSGRTGTYITVNTNADSLSNQTRIFEQVNRVVRLLSDGRSLLYIDTKGNLRKRDLRTNQEELLFTIPETNILNPRISPDGRSISWIENRERGKFVMIENLFIADH